MEMRKSYTINQFTSALISDYGENGYLHTKVIEGHSVFIVKLPPFKIIKDSMKHYGHSWEGAKKATKSILGDIDMPPIKISGSLGIYWFPSKSPDADDCVWFALQRIDDYLSIAPKKTKVIFNSDLYIIVPMSIKQFKDRLHRAIELKSVFEKRTMEDTYPWPHIFQGTHPILNDPRTLYYFNKPSQELNADDIKH